MAKTKVFDAKRTDISFNMTPMIDCTFQLIIFFILAGNFASLDNVRLEVPTLHESVAQELGSKNAVINIPPWPEKEIAAFPDRLGQAYEWRISVHKIKPGDVTLLSQILKEQRNAYVDSGGKEEDFKIEIRADESIYYSEMKNILTTAAELGIQKMEITAHERLVGGL